MNQRKIFTCFCMTILLGFVSVNTYASGKQIRPPAIDMCEVDPDSENCGEAEKTK